MTVCLYECLKAAGLQRHYARFTLVGVCRAAQLSALNMEDYFLLGISSMEDRMRLFHLVQLVKTIDLKNLNYDDGNDYDYNGGDEYYAAVEGSFSPDDYRNPDEDVNEDQDENGAAICGPDLSSCVRPSYVRRCLDFSDDTIDDHQRLFSHPVGTGHVYESHKRNGKPVEKIGSTTQVQLQPHRRNVVACGCRESSSYELDVHTSSCLWDFHAGQNSKQDIRGGNCMFNSYAGLPPNHENCPKFCPETLTSKTFNNKPFGHKDTKRISKKKIRCTDMAKSTPVYEAKGTAGYNYGLPLSSTHAPNKKQVDGQRISVCVRKRPLTHAESRGGETDVVTASGEECVIVRESKEAVDLTQYILQHKFYFDQVFGEESSNEEVYLRTAYPLVQHMLSGGKATCFAYGQTGAGKTHTMLGSSPGRPGLYALAVRDIFAHLSTTHVHPSPLVYVSFFEIYCGQLYDLLDHRKRLFAREDGQKVVHISGLRDVRVDSVSLLLEVISQGTAERTQGMSGVNPLSSRSHALLQIQLRDANQQVVGRMWFVDLAGSERASDAKEPNRQSRMEAAEINQSLLALKECIRSLDKEESHTPFRQSKLTQVLKDSFLGDSMTCMIANISPGHPATEHTLNTLRYADRVKELKGQGGPRGRRGSKIVPSPKLHMSINSSCSSGVGTPKKPKLRKQSRAFGPSTPTTSLHTGATFLCSTPKSSVCEEETQALGRKGIGLKHLTPVRGCLSGTSCENKGADEREGSRYGRTHSPYVREESTRTVLVLGQQNDEQKKQEEASGGLLAFAKRESGFNHREKENRQRRMKEGRGEETEWIEPRQKVESSRNTSCEVARQRERYLDKVDDKERKRHLRLYHHQLQQFMPSSASSSIHPLSSSTLPSFSSSTQDSLFALPHSCHHLLSSHLYHGLEDISDPNKTRVGMVDCNREQMHSPRGETHMQTKTSTNSSNKNNAEAHRKCGGAGEDWKVSLERMETSSRQDRCKSGRRRSLEATDEARVRKEDRKPVDGRERRCHRAVATEMESANRMICPNPTVVESQLSYSCYSEERKEVVVEGPDASDIPDDGVRSTGQREATDCYSLESSHSSNDSSSLFSHLPFESHRQRAPAERPLSPPFEHINSLMTPNKPSEASPESKYPRFNANIRTLPLQNTPKTASSDGPKKALCFSTLPLTTIMTQTGRTVPVKTLNKQSEDPVYSQTQNNPDINVKKLVLPQEETCVESFSSVMDPLSISLLQVDQWPATASFLQRNTSNTSLYPAESERGDDNERETGKEGRSCVKMVEKFAEDDDAEFCLSFLELPQERTFNPAAYNTVKDTDHAGRRINTKSKFCGKVKNRPPISGFMLASHQDPEDNQKNHTPTLDNKATASPTKTSACASLHTPASNSKISPRPKNPQEISSRGRHSNRQIKPTVHLLSIDDLDQAKCCITEAHLEQLKEMEALCHKEGKLLCHQRDMAFEEYVRKLAEIVERKARCVHSMRAQLQPYLKPIQAMNPQTQRGDNDHDPIM
ncbi:uncharacterized protein PAE49_007223 isoform 2-T2 [Odontesthes bonariensis]